MTPPGSSQSTMDITGKLWMMLARASYSKQRRGISGRGRATASSVRSAFDALVPYPLERIQHQLWLGSDIRGQHAQMFRVW